LQLKLKIMIIIFDCRIIIRGCQKLIIEKKNDT
jgi:hypothetical protein